MVGYNDEWVNNLMLDLFLSYGDGYSFDYSGIEAFYWDNCTQINRCIWDMANWEVW